MRFTDTNEPEYTSSNFMPYSNYSWYLLFYGLCFSAYGLCVEKNSTWMIQQSWASLEFHKATHLMPKQKKLEHIYARILTNDN